MRSLLLLFPAICLAIILITPPLAGSDDKMPQKVVPALARPAPLAERVKAANYTPPPFKFNPRLNQTRNLLPLLMAPERTALLVIDVQNFFTAPPTGAPDGPKIIPNINMLANYCRDHNIPVIWIQETNRADGSDLGMIGKYHSFLAPPASTLSPGNEGWKLYKDLNNKPDDIYVRKTKYNAFWGSDLEAILRAMGIESLICTGIAIDGCVAATIADAFHRDFNPILVMDAATSATLPQARDYFFSRIEFLNARVLTTGEVVAELEALKPGR